METFLPVITIANPNRLDQSGYREKCANRLINILLNLDNYLGTGRIFIP